MNLQAPGLVIVLALLLLAPSACSPSAETAAERAAAPGPVAAPPYAHPESGLTVVPLTIETDGESHTFKVEVAQTPEQQWMGLRFRSRMGEDEGMIFPREAPRPASFTMQNTEIPLDMIFIGEDGVIDSIIADTEPFEPGPFRSEEPAMAILELNAGTSARLGIAPGDRVVWEMPLAPAGN